MPPLTSIHRGFCTITSFISLLHHTMVGSTPSNVFTTCPKLCAYCIRCTRATWMRLVMISLGHRALACNFDIYRYSLPLLTCRSFSAVHIQFLLHFGLGHRLMKSTITTSASSPPHIHNSSLLFPSISRSTIQSESRLYRYIYIFPASQPCTLGVHIP